MVKATDLKNGMKFLLDGKPHVVTKYAHTKIGRGGASVKVSARNLEAGNLSEHTFNSTQKFEDIATTKITLQYLYADADSAVFMNDKTFEQVEIPLEVLGDSIKYVKEGESADILFWGDQSLSLEIAPSVTMEIVETAPGVKGNSATNVFKPAKLANGLEVKVPLFIKKGDKIKVDTRTGAYVERVNS